MAFFKTHLLCDRKKATSKHFMPRTMLVRMRGSL
jgi:hypothetical protein